jgi:hypothetical protein
MLGLQDHRERIEVIKLTMGKLRLKPGHVKWRRILILGAYPF